MYSLESAGKLRRYQRFNLLKLMVKPLSQSEGVVVEVIITESVHLVVIFVPDSGVNLLEALSAEFRGVVRGGDIVRGEESGGGDDGQGLA